MLASPLYPSPPTFSPQHSSEDPRQYRPTKDIEAFNNLLPPPIEFVEGSSSDSLAVAEGKYEPINATPKRSKTENRETAKSVSDSVPATPASASLNKSPGNSKARSLYTGDIDLSWPQGAKIGSGLYNTGNTCFLNSSLQCLLHTPPLLNLLLKHNPSSCPVKNSFCMTCSLYSVARDARSNRGAFSPNAVSGKLNVIAKHMRRGRQEDSHEFLRYAVDALQKSCLSGLPSKLDPKLAETTWVHKLFGGRLRSRVACQSCGHNSDTFDSILDLSLDIYGSQNLKDALYKFVAPDYLKGANKYKCEKCKKHVNASKKFTIHDAPVVLTVHLKRFSPTGNKIGHMVTYDEQLSLSSYMSEGQYGPSYSLYGVICHAGGGPHSGHYYAYVKSKDNRWYEMNDESVSPTSTTPTRIKNSYILFYMKNKGQRLESVLKGSPNANATSALPFTPTQVPKVGLASQMKKKRAREEGGNGEGKDAKEDQGVKVNKPFIGPLLPSQAERESGEDSPSMAKKPRLAAEDPQALAIKKKIESSKTAAAKASLSTLAGYGSDGDEDMDKEADGDKPEEVSSKKVSESLKTTSAPLSSPRLPTPSTTPATSSPNPVPTASFYATPPGMKRKSASSSFNGISPAPRRMDKKNGFNPYSGLIRYGKKNKRARGI